MTYLLVVLFRKKTWFIGLDTSPIKMVAGVAEIPSLPDVSVSHPMQTSNYATNSLQLSNDRAVLTGSSPDSCHGAAWHPDIDTYADVIQRTFYTRTLLLKYHRERGRRCKVVGGLHRWVRDACVRRQAVGTHYNLRRT